MQTRNVTLQDKAVAATIDELVCKKKLHYTAYPQMNIAPCSTVLPYHSTSVSLFRLLKSIALILILILIANRIRHVCMHVCILTFPGNSFSGCVWMLDPFLFTEQTDRQPGT